MSTKVVFNTTIKGNGYTTFIVRYPRRAVGVGNWGNCGASMRAGISNPTPFIYLAFEIKKNRPIHILERLKC